jgi:hypothetical protein
MTKNELKELIKPLVKQCLNEVLLEEGTLSTVIAEIVEGLGIQNRLVESVQHASPVPPSADDTGIRRKLQETRKRMLNAVGQDGYSGVDIFEGTTPLSSGGTPGNSPSPTSPLAGMDPNDPGVDINAVLPGIDKVWKKFL